MNNGFKHSLLIIFTFLFKKCFAKIDDRDGCDGSIELLNKTPDATIVLSHDYLTLDLSGTEDFLFKHVAGETWHFYCL